MSKRGRVREEPSVKAEGSSPLQRRLRRVLGVRPGESA